MILVLGGLSLHQPFQQSADSLGRQQAVRETFRHEAIELLSIGDRAALAGGLYAAAGRRLGRSSTGSALTFRLICMSFTMTEAAYLLNYARRPVFEIT